jgi:hypothetical protein
MRDAIKTLLENDATLMAILTGGVHTGTEISRQDTPEAFDASDEILPCVLLQFGTAAPAGPYSHSSMLHFSLMFYERSGYENVEAARERAYVLLHRQKVTPAAGACWGIRHADDVLDQEDTALGCSLAISRYYGVIRRA